MEVAFFGGCIWGGDEWDKEEELNKNDFRMI
jgi:hypothetical protein